MNKTKTRCLSLALVIGVLMLVGSGVAFAGETHSTGLTVSKSCPAAPVAQGATISCSYTITNSGDTQHSVGLTSATETVPCPTPDMVGNCGAGAGVPFDVLTPSLTNTGCLQGDPPVAVTSLGPAGTGTASCTGSFEQVVPETCDPLDATIIDKVEAAGTDADPGTFNGLQVGNFTTNIINVLGKVCNGEFCRTPGFWATHVGGGDKACSQNVTLAVIQDVGSLLICGELIDDTDVDSADSAVEAMCVAVQGQLERQLARQLTAAALNCVVTSGDADCTGVSIDALFDACNLMCDPDAGNNPVGYTVGGCIEEIDCFNNGGVWDPADGGSCSTGTCSNDATQVCTQNDLTNCGEGAECVPLPNNCHDAEFGDFDFVDLPNDGLPTDDPCFEKQGPANSSACKAAKKTDCTVIQPGEAECVSGSIE